MKKLTFAVLLGGFLGVFDGLTAWFTPEVRADIVGIVIGSTIKGIITGLLIGLVARKTSSLPIGVGFGLAVGLLLAFGVTQMQRSAGQPAYYWQIMLPGAILGMIVGYATIRYRESARTTLAA